MTFTVSTSEQMQAFGKKIGALLAAGDVVVLSGPLGAGKTTFVQGLATQIEVQGVVTSPTFVVSRVHKPQGSGLALVHVDAYRLTSQSDLVDLDLDVTKNAVFVIEWGREYVSGFSENWIEIDIDRAQELTDESDPASGIRRISVTAVGDRWSNLSLSGPGA
ncbi:MAG: tRNA (adenosine(37)-N6)-threonylcarbamoyltransferase complex ATPase subunit type 1 TsaE [Actinomycetes bacterium]